VDEQQRRVTEDLAGLLAGEIRCDPLTVAMYSSDASLYQIAPMGIVYPRNCDDVITLARYSSEREIPMIARGAGSGVAGQVVGQGLVVDFSRHMSRIEQIGEKTVRVQPGIVRNQLNRALREHGRYFPPDPSNSAVSTIGSMLAVDGAGSHSVRVGSTRDHVQSIELILAGGHSFEVGSESLDILKTRPSKPTPTSLLDPSIRSSESTNLNIKRTIVSKLAKLLADNEALIQEKQPPLIRNTCGYYLRGVLAEGCLNLPRLLVGSEGTLGIFTAATLHTAPLSPHRGVVLLLFGQMEAAVRSVRAIARLQPSACDLLDRRLLTLAREADAKFAELISPVAEAALIVEQTGFSDQQVRDRIQMAIRSVRALKTGAVVAREAYTFEDVEFLWSLPARVVPLLTRLKGATRPLPFVEDVAVLPEALQEFLVRAQKVFQKHQVTASLYAHAAAGQLHLRPFLPSPSQKDGQRIEAIARDLYQAVFAVGGTISGEHGDGLARTAFIRSQYGPLYKVFQEIKDIFDPHNLMNPGKIINDDPHITLRNLRPDADPSPEFVDLQLRWSSEELTQVAARCNGCAACRTQVPDMRMCPFFRIDQIEEASPRAKANVMRNLACGTLNNREMTSESMKQLSSLCFNCKQCQLECPSNVNIPHLMIEAKAALVAANGLNRADWILSRAHSFGMLGSSASLAVNWAIGNPAARWLLEKTLGIARQRKLPRFARRSFVRSADQSVLRRPEGSNGSPPVVYFVGDYANFHDPELARAFVAILQHHEIPVHVPRDQSGSAMAMISAGDLDAARKVAEQNIHELAELARDGCQIVCTEPSVALCLKQEYPMLLDHPDVELVASQTIEAGEYLQQLHSDGRFRTDFQPLKLEVGYHAPCHLKALGDDLPLRNLLALIPELRVRTIEEGCSGMAGAYGLTRENFRTSIRLGWGLISRMRGDEFDVGSTECSSCKIQMEQGTSSPTLHPLKLIALSYGLMPEIQRRLKPAIRKLVVT
jgi:FAD/FMN-containing dehydrogenase/Fe-S oxidoreductase